MTSTPVKALFLAALLAQPARAAITEDKAIALVASAMRRIEPVPSRCLSFMTEESSRSRFDIAVAENHARGCGGDPGALTVVERFRIQRSPVRLLIYDAVNDAYRPCPISKSKRPRCPSP